MNGAGKIRFSELFADTILAHGELWAINYYTKRGMQEWELMFWLREFHKRR